MFKAILETADYGKEELSQEDMEAFGVAGIYDATSGKILDTGLSTTATLKDNKDNVEHEDIPDIPTPISSKEVSEENTSSLPRKKRKVKLKSISAELSNESCSKRAVYITGNLHEALKTLILISDRKYSHDGSISSLVENIIRVFLEENKAEINELKKEFTKNLQNHITL